MKKQLTIIIPSHERQRLIARALEYYRLWDVSLIVCDSSRKSLDLASTAEMTYLHCPELGFSQKIAKALDLIETPYCCMCADDDFLASRGVQAGLEFLNIHPDYVSVQGHYISFELQLGRLYYFVRYENAIGFHIDGELASDRVIKTFNPYVQHFYSVHRTWVMQRSLRISVRLKSLIHAEINTAFVGMIYGKHKVLPIFWMARDSNRYTGYTENSSDKDTDVIWGPNGWKAYLATEEGRYHRELFAQAYAEGTGEQVERGCEVFERAFEAYFEYNNNSENVPLNWRDVVKQFIPGGILQLRRKYLYTPSAFEKRSIAEHKETPGFPWSDADAAKDWEGMKAVILKHGSLVSTVAV